MPSVKVPPKAKSVPVKGAPVPAKSQSPSEEDDSSDDDDDDVPGM
jgi:hypothetical protein